jgi:hypothetical protein
MGGQRRCLSCGERFSPRPQNRGQQYCSKPACQRDRRRRWQSAKQRTDADYRDNHRRAQQAWSAKHGTYWGGRPNRAKTYGSVLHAISW